MIEVLRFTIPVFMVGALGVAVGSRGVSADTRRARWIKFLVYVLIVHTVLGAAWSGAPVVVGLFVVIAAAAGVEMWRVRRAGAFDTGRWLLPAGVFVLCACGTVRYVDVAGPGLITFTYLVVAAFDGFSQVGGQILGRHRLAGVVSPGKTVEGAVGGLLAAVAIAWLLRAFSGMAAPLALVFAVVCAAAGLAGDLGASWVKRRAGIKDFGHVLPGHGGALDRFDSFLAAATIAWIWHLMAGPSGFLFAS